MVSTTALVAGSIVSTVALAWSTRSTVFPPWTVSSWFAPARTTELSSNTSVLARPITCSDPFATQTEASSSCIFCAVYPVETMAIVATTAAISVALVTVATSER